MELKQAKQQSQDLHRTSAFFSTLLTLEPGEKAPPPPLDIIADEPQTNGVSQLAPIDAISPFSQPPAPPPQQPLPEKPDLPRYNVVDPLAQSPLKRTETETPKSPLPLPSKPEPASSQIISLVEALTAAKREIDSQGDRVKHLEVLLRRERKARETAEERARRLLEKHNFPNGENQENGVVEDEAFEPPPDSPDQSKQQLMNGFHGQVDDVPAAKDSQFTIGPPDLKRETTEKPYHDTKAIDTSTTLLQERLNLMVREMDEMKLVMESYKRRAEGAERERNGLAEMVERIRAGTDPTITSTTSNTDKSTPNTETSSHQISLDQKSLDSSPSAVSPQRSQNDVPLSGDSRSHDVVVLQQHTLSTVLQSHRWGNGSHGEVAMQSAPYVSMVGVVLIGVGIMTWLNGWQRGER